MPGSRRKVARILLILAIVLVVLATAVVLRVWWGGRDLASPGDDDMRFARDEVPAPENGFPFLRDGAQKLAWSEEREVLLRDALLGKDVDADSVSALVAENRESLDAVREALQAKRLQVPPEEPDGKLGYSILEFRQLGGVMFFGARTALRSDDLESALNDVLDMVRFGRASQDAQGGLILHMIGSGIAGSGLQEIRKMLREPGLDGKAARRLLDELPLLAPDPAAFREAMQHEYTVMASAVDDATLQGSEGARLPVLGRYIFQKNATKKLFADAYRRIVEDSTRPCSAADLAVPDISPEGWQRYAKLHEPNLVGRVTFSIGLPSVRSLLLSNCRANVEVSATLALAALRAHFVEHGRAPETLASLVPAYLPAVPVDAFDGKPLRYSGEKQVLYSVGENLSDEGGQPQNDLVFSLPF